MTRKSRESVERFLCEVSAEISRAMAKHPRPQSSRHESYAVLLEEVEEFWDLVKARNPSHAEMRAELVQVAAMAARAVVDLGLEAGKACKKCGKVGGDGCGSCLVPVAWKGPDADLSCTWEWVNDFPGVGWPGVDRWVGLARDAAEAVGIGAMVRNVRTGERGIVRGGGVESMPAEWGRPGILIEEGGEDDGD